MLALLQLTGNRSVCPAFRAKPANLRARHANFDSAIAGNLLLQVFVEFAFEFTHFSALNAGDVNVIARAVAFVVMTMASKMEEVQFVDQPVVFEQFQGTIDGHACNLGIDLLSLLKDFGRIHMANRGFNYLNHDAALTRETNAPGAKLALKLAGRFVNVDAFACGDAMCRSRRHLKAQYSKMRRRGWLGAFGYW